MRCRTHRSPVIASGGERPTLRCALATSDSSAEGLRRSFAQDNCDLRNALLTPRSVQAYRSDFQHFTTWLDLIGMNIDEAIGSPEIVEVSVLGYLRFYLFHPSQRISPALASRRLAGIRWCVIERGLSWPNYSRRSNPFHHAVATAKSSHESSAVPTKPMTTSVLTQMVNACGSSPIELRDRALLLIGFCGGFRRSELMALNVEDIAFLDEGVAIRVADPRTDAAGSAREVFIARGRHPETCPVRALDQWLSLLDRRDGPMFVRMYKGGVVGTSRAGLVLVDHVVKRRAQLSGVDGHYTAHSLRSGLAASAAEGGADYLTILRQTGHVSLASFTGYLQAPADVDQNVMQYLDL